MAKSKMIQVDEEQLKDIIVEYLQFYGFSYHKRREIADLVADELKRLERERQK